MRIQLSLVLLGVALTLLGALLAIMGRRGRRIDDHPLCRKCGYDLTGRPETSDRCAECGAELSARRAIRVGNRLPSRRLFWGGLSLTAISLLLCAALSWLWLTKLDLMQYKPLWLVRDEASSPRAVQRNRAVAELTRRFVAGELTDGQIQAIISGALPLHADPLFPWTEWGGLINKLCMAGKISDQDWITLVRQSVELRLLTRSRVRAGDPMPVALALDTRRLPRPNPPGGVIVNMPPLPPPALEVEWLELTLVDVTAPVPGYSPARGPGWGSPMVVNGATFEKSQTATLTPGIHPLKGRILIHVLDQKTQKRIASSDASVTTQVTILPAETDPKSLFVSDPALSEEIKAAIWRVDVTPLSRGTITDMHVLQLSVSDPPIGLAHQAYLRTPDGREFPFGSITFGNRGNGGSNRYARVAIGSFDSVDVILRPDLDLVTQSTRNDAIWGEDIVFPNVKILPRGTPIRSGGSPPTSRRARGRG